MQEVKTEKAVAEITAEQVIRRWPRLVAHLICQSLGYFTPTGAASCIADYKNGREDCCEYIMSCYRSQPLPAIQDAIKGRHHHAGFMSHYPAAIAIVIRYVKRGDEPQFMSW